ncbi:MAG: hypothetical protein H0V94_09655 [Actinobacteria bacterium]|nr:hypothetical protein [Actinomycetota bacterium]
MHTVGQLEHVACGRLVVEVSDRLEESLALGRPHRRRVRARRDQVDERRSVEPLYVPEELALDLAELNAGNERIVDLVIPLCFAPDQLGQPRDPLLVVVARIPQDADNAAGPEHPRHLAQRHRLVEPVEGLGDDDCVRGSVGERNLLRGARHCLHAGDVRAQLVEHLLERLDRNDVVAERRERSSQLARPGPEIHHARARLAHEPPGRLCWIAGARSLVGAGDRTERARPNGRVLAQTRPRSERIAST